MEKIVMKENKLYTFWTLLQENHIVIPKVQRDYAYGRQDSKAREVRKKILNNLHDTLSGKCGVITLDFIYGSKIKGLGLIPLDGQQRLTTLFLLHLYAARREKVEAPELSRFTYETRTSASQFCEKLSKGTIRINWDEQPSRQIQDCNEFLPTYEDDPTIRAMLVMLDDIQDKFADIPDLWEKLIREENPYIQFYFLQLDKFGLTDDLYVKMNSRGKPLTEYEIFKSNLEGHLEQLVANDSCNRQEWLDLITDFMEKLDTSWTDMLWKNSGNDVLKVDKGFLNIFQIVFRIRYNLLHDGASISEERTISDSIHDMEDLKFFISFFDVFEAGFRDNTFQQFWDEFFYTSSEAVGERRRIRLFGRSSQDNIFVTAMRGMFTNADYVFAYGIYLTLKYGVDKDIAFVRLRILRNLLMNSEYELRGTKVGMMLKMTELLIGFGTIPTDGFNANQIDEEMKKEQAGFDLSLLRYENHAILRGSLKLFIDNDKLALLEKFERLFNNEYIVNTPMIRSELLKYGDYSQYFYQQTNRRCFVNRAQQWSSFFTYNSNRHNQEAILQCLEQCPELSEMPSSKDLPTDWRYYMIKYDCESWVYESVSQGMYNWDDVENSPLIINVLNSRSHINRSNNGYIEWNLLNRILAYRNYGILRLDYHSSSPVEIPQANISINAVQSGWQINVFEDEHQLIEKLIKDGFNIVDSIYIVSGKDFITEGEILIQKIISYTQDKESL